MNIKECYRVLSITPDTSLDDMHHVYRFLVRVRHPDKYVNNPRLQAKAEYELKQINMAYDILKKLFFDKEQRSKEQQHKEREG